jgi:hypothetical protein
MNMLAYPSIVAVLAALVGCAGYGLTPEQIKEMSAAQSSACVNGASWNGSPLLVHYTFFGGKSTGTAGGGGKASCGASVVEFNNEGKLLPTPKVVTTVTTTAPQ